MSSRPPTYPPLPSDPETAAAIAEAAIRTVETAKALIQTALRLDRGDRLSAAEGEYNERPGGSYLAQRQGYLALGHMELGIQKLRESVKGWKQNTEDAQKGKGDA